MFCIIKLNCDWVQPIVCATFAEAQTRIENKSRHAPGEWYAITEFWGENGVLWDEDNGVGDVLEIWHNGHGIEWARESA